MSVQKAAGTIPGLVLAILLTAAGVRAQDPVVNLKDLIEEAWRNNPEILSAEAKAESASKRISQQSSLPDPMLSVGYQNEGLSQYNYGESPDAQWMFSLSQTFSFPGKLALQEEAASQDALAEKANARSVRRQVALRVTEAYYDLFLATKELDLIEARRPLVAKLEDAALARYSSGTGSSDEVIMAQAERYMLIEKEAMARRKMESIEASLARETGRGGAAAIGRPADAPPAEFHYTQEQLVAMANEKAPELAMQQSLMQASYDRLLRSRKEAWPDVTLMATYTSRNGPYKDMYALTASVPLPLFYQKKQGAGIAEAAWNQASARRDLETARLKIQGEIRDNLAMVTASARVMELYRGALIPKARQAVDVAMAQYASGRMDASTALAKLKAPFDYELTAWEQQVEREKAIARIKAVTGDLEGLR